MQINLCSLNPYKYNNVYNSKKESYNNFFSLHADTVSFGVKKSEFRGIDLLIVNKFKVPIEKFQNNNELQSWAKVKIENEYLSKNYKGRQKETVIQRQEMFKEWSDYVLKENDAYNNSIALLIIDGITKNLNPDDDTLPPVLNKGVLADTISEIQTKSENNKNYQVDFNKLYKTKLKELYSLELKDKVEENSNSGWIIIPSKENDFDNFEANVEKLKTLSHNSWCTKSFNAKPYLSQGDFHVYLENGKPKIGVRFVGNKIEEIQGEKNNSKIPFQYLEITKSHIKNEILSDRANREVKSAEKVQEKVYKMQEKLCKTYKEATSEELLTCFGMLEKVDDGFFILNEYRQPDEDFDWYDIGIDENKLFKNIKEIKGNADFEKSQVTDLGKLQLIGGNANFKNSQITDLGNLQLIGGNANFRQSKIINLGKLELIGGDAIFISIPAKDLGLLQKIGGDADFRSSKISNLGQLHTIGGDAFFYGSKITNLGNLRIIGKDADFSISIVKDLGKLHTIGGYAKIYKSHLKISDFENINIGKQIWA